jgi:WD40 repeat protein
MPILSRLIFTLILCSFLTVGCQPASATPTLPPAMTKPVLPTTTPFPATETPIPEQPTSSSVISAGNASQLKQIAALELPESMPNTLVFSPDGRTLLSGDASGEVNLWEGGAWQKTAFLAPQSDFKRDAVGKASFSGTLALSPDGEIIVTTNFAGEVKGQEWDGTEQFTFPFGELVYQTAISPDGKFLAVGGFSKKLLIFGLETNQQLADLGSDYEFISNLVFSPDGKTLLVSYERPGNVMKTWETATWKETATFSHTAERFDYHDILFTPDGKTLVIASTRNVIEFFDLESRQVVKELPGHVSAPYEMALSPDGSLLASAGDDQTLRLWDLKTGKAVLVLRNQHEVGTVAFSPDGKLLAFGVWNEGIRVWAMDSAAASAPPATTAPTVSPAAAPSLDLTVISAATVSQVKLQTKLIGHTGRVFSVAFSSDGRLLASAGQNNEVKLWDVTTQQEIKSFKHNGDWAIFFLANDQQLASNNGEVWNIENGEMVHAAAANRSQVTFSSDGRWMALAPSNLPIELWNTATWQIERTLNKHSDAVIGMAFSADNTLLATGSAMGPDGIADISIKLWNVADGRELFTLKGHRTDIHAVAFSPDGSLLASGGIDPTVKIWDVKSGTLIRSLQSGEGVMDVIFSPDGTLVASAGSDGTVKLWDVASGNLLKTLRHPDELMAVAFSPDGTLLVSGGYDNLIYFWGIPK